MLATDEVVVDIISKSGFKINQLLLDQREKDLNADDQRDCADKLSYVNQVIGSQDKRFFVDGVFRHENLLSQEVHSINMKIHARQNVEEFWDVLSALVEEEMQLQTHKEDTNKNLFLDFEDIVMNLPQRGDYIQELKLGKELDEFDDLDLTFIEEKCYEPNAISDVRIVPSTTITHEC